METVLLQINNLFFSYEENIHALCDISVKIHKNEKIVVLGSNGSGKSTFFLILNGVREPDQGEILLHGEIIKKKTRNKLRKSVGIVFQDADSQIIGSTVKAEIAFGPLNMKLKREEVTALTDRAVTRLALQEYTERPPHYLSGGEKKRVSIADILAMNPELIIFDEPTASLDPLHADLLEKILGELEQEGKTILLSTHDVDFAYRFADRILVFVDGTLAADGSVYDIFQDEELLQKANLKKPMIMQVYEQLKKSGIIDCDHSAPRTILELGQMIPDRYEL